MVFHHDKSLYVEEEVKVRVAKTMGGWMEGRFIWVGMGDGWVDAKGISRLCFTEKILKTLTSWKAL